ncbi:PREDICTED: 28S ribosomal protein S14, mitochondrial-like [Priapulus caudatus]|uniref:28S ribosomal protein S14, mitochondrial-like n=1 Tax=Priapulus caudatus TaxID=37621 RepID=A0ABM1E5X5_PRICU|nr:PREDICTED: 28S ribosomal protein S14, mitochondrial-like [Priapulus caudatus]
MAASMQSLIGLVKHSVPACEQILRIGGVIFHGSERCYSDIAPLVIKYGKTGVAAGKWQDCRMRRDFKRRWTIKQWAPERLRVNSLRKNDILPADLRAIADTEIAAMPRDGSISRCHKRCIVTSRARGLLKRWRVSRFIFRHLADYNYLSGVKRSCW